jgi:hypothetical protein
VVKDGSIFSLKNEPGEKIYFSHKMSLEGEQGEPQPGLLSDWM